jgi:hypothetical protein
MASGWCVVPINLGVSGHNGFEPESVVVPGVYEHVLREWCREEVMNPNNGYPVNCYGALEYEHEKYAAWEAEVEEVADTLFSERLGLAEPVVAWWYWLPKNLPPPLDTLGRDPAPRRLRVYPDDRVALLAPGESLRWSRGGGAGTPTGPATQ